VSDVKLGGRESDLTIPQCGLAIMKETYVRSYCTRYGFYFLHLVIRQHVTGFGNTYGIRHVSRTDYCTERGTAHHTLTQSG
jgi:hypothetical protein